MPKARKKKIPVTGTSTDVKSSTPQASRTTIRRFHVLLKRRTQLSSSSTPTDVQELAAISQEIEEMGGIEGYQRMSAIGQGKDRGGGSEKIFIDWLLELGARKQAKKIRLLEVGALKPDNYSPASSWIDATPMDLHSRHPDILEQDFLKMDIHEHKDSWNAISLSLVLNFAPDARDRGRMLRLAHGMLAAGGYLYLALPLPCLLNSRYLDEEHLRKIMTAVGFHEVRSRWKKDGKMAYLLYEKRSPADVILAEVTKKSVLRQGNRNNFAILL